MKKLISKVLLALITLSVVTPVCAGVPSIVLQGINMCKKGMFFGLSGLGGVLAGGIVGYGLRTIYILRDPKQNPSKLENHVRDEGLTDAQFNNNYRASERLDRIATQCGAFLGACAGIYLASRRYSKV